MSRTSSFPVKRRSGFTLVELLVAMALILFIMSIVSVAFVDSTESFRLFRARAELSEKLRFITQTLRSDLRANHFENNRRLSDPDFWEQGPPRAGYLRVEQAVAGTGTSTMDGDTITTAGPTDKHVLMMTSFLQGQDYRGFHSVSDPSPAPNPSLLSLRNWLGANGFASDSRLETGNSYNSPDAEIAWFMGNSRPANMPAVTQYDFAKNSASFDRLDAGDLGVILYKLYRRVSPMLPCDPASAAEPGFDPTLLTRASAVPSTIGATIASNKRKFNGVSSQLDPNCDVPFRRFFARYMASNSVSGWKTAGFNSYLATDATTPGAAADYAVIADNVLSFSIEVWPEGAINFSSVQAAFGQSVFDTWCGRSADPNWGVNADFAAFTANNKPKWRDSTDPSCVPMTSFLANGLPKRLLAVRITIRLYDLNTKSTWQATVIEYL
jgi:prepilin-type N-terminal cleavage/methylation domain-containing protein